MFRRLGFHEGVLFNGIAAILAGAGGVRAVTATDQFGLFLGWAGVLLGLGLIVWGFKIDGDHWWKYQRDPNASLPPESPIHVHDVPYADCVDPVDANGQKVEGVEVVRLCLWVTNSIETGQVLRNVVARLWSATGDSYLLPIHGEEGGSTNIRHGEHAKIEVGNVRVPSDPPPLANHRIGTCVVDRMEAEHNTRNGFRSLYVRDKSGNERLGIGSAFPNGSGLTFPNVRVIISADDVISRTVWLDLYLYEERPHDWIKIKPEFSRAELE